MPNQINESLESTNPKTLREEVESLIYDGKLFLKALNKIMDEETQMLKHWKAKGQKETTQNFLRSLRAILDRTKE